MQNIGPRQPRPTTPADLHRLAALAQARGLRLTQERESVWSCSSASQHGDPHYVTGFSCDCRGFMEHQRCSHYALLLERLGWLPEVEAELPAVANPTASQENGRAHAESPQATVVNPTVACPDCCGCGLVDFGRYTLPCEGCNGTGVKPDRRLQGQPTVEVVAAAA
jgi:hypothetical protein